MRISEFTELMRMTRSELYQSGAADFSREFVGLRDGLGRT
jgi:hypothetical protein